jgi:hypothetical protein
LVQICHVVSEENGFYSLETTGNDGPQVVTKAQTKTLLLFLSFLVEKFPAEVMLAGSSAAAMK